MGTVLTAVPGLLFPVSLFLPSNFCTHLTTYPCWRIYSLILCAWRGDNNCKNKGLLFSHIALAYNSSSKYKIFKINKFCARYFVLVFFCSFKFGSVHILCIKPVFAPSLLQGMICLSSEVVSSAHCCSLDGEALLLHVSLLVLVRFRVCSE